MNTKLRSPENAVYELELILRDEKKDRDRQTVFLGVNDLTSLTSQEYLTGNMKITYIFLSLQGFFVKYATNDFL